MHGENVFCLQSLRTCVRVKVLTIKARHTTGSAYPKLSSVIFGQCHREVAWQAFFATVAGELFLKQTKQTAIAGNPETAVGPRQ